MALIPKESSLLALRYGWDALPRILRRYWWCYGIAFALFLSPFKYIGVIPSIGFCAIPAIIFCCSEAGAEIQFDRTTCAMIALFFVQNIPASYAGVLMALPRHVPLPRGLVVPVDFVALIVVLYLLSATAGVWSTLAFFLLGRGKTKSIEQAYRISWDFAQRSTWKRLVIVAVGPPLAIVIVLIPLFLLHVLTSSTAQSFPGKLTLSIFGILTNTISAAGSVALATTRSLPNVKTR